MDIERVVAEIVDASLALHRRLGPGLLESVYEAVLARDLEKRGLIVVRHQSVAFELDGMHFNDGLRVDLIVEGAVVVELKAVEKLASVHWRQVLTYLRLLDMRVGLLINFGGATLKEGLHRVINDYRIDTSDIGAIRSTRSHDTWKDG